MAIFIDPPKPRTLDMAELFRGANPEDGEVLVRNAWGIQIWNWGCGSAIGVRDERL